LACLLLAILGIPAHAVEPRDIGTAVEIRNTVTAAQGSEAKRRLIRQDHIREQEVLESAINSRGEFILADDTKLVLGPTARLVLNEFVYDPNQHAGNKVAINFVKGAFRFISSGTTRQNYEIRTPLATLGIRGTKIDGYVADDGSLALLLNQSSDETTEVEVCSTVTMARNCQRLRSQCHVINVTAAGVVMPERPNWENSLLPGVPVQMAFPFLETRLTVDPTIQCRYADLYTPPHILRKALAPAPIPGPPAPPPPPPAPLPIALIATAIAVPVVINDMNDDINRPISP